MTSHHQARGWVGARPISCSLRLSLATQLTLEHVRRPTQDEYPGLRFLLEVAGLHEDEPCCRLELRVPSRGPHVGSGGRRATRTLYRGQLSHGHALVRPQVHALSRVSRPCSLACCATTPRRTASMTCCLIPSGMSPHGIAR